MLALYPDQFARQFAFGGKAFRFTQATGGDVAFDLLELQAEMRRRGIVGTGRRCVDPTALRRIIQCGTGDRGNGDCKDPEHVRPDIVRAASIGAIWQKWHCDMSIRDARIAAADPARKP